MAVFFESGYSLPGGDEPLTHARILHANNWLSGGTVSASTTGSEYFADAPANSLTYEFWSPDTINAETWEYDHGSSAECDVCCIAAHNLFTAGSSVDVEYYNGSSWVTLVSATPTDNSPIMAIFAPITAQRWRIAVQGVSVAPVIGVIRFGKALQMPRPSAASHKPLVYGRNVEMRTNESETGEWLGRTIQRKNLKTSYGWSIIEDTWFEANWPATQQAFEAEPFFLAWRPGDDDSVGYCVVNESPAPSYSGRANYMGVTMNVTARAWE